jgi:hypothetical protein
VLLIRIRSDPDPDVPDMIRTRILPFINDPISTYLVCKSNKYFRNLCCLTYWYMNTLLEYIFIFKKSRKKLAENLFWSGSGSGNGSRSRRFQKSDLDPAPVKNRQDPQHCCKCQQIFILVTTVSYSCHG